MIVILNESAAEGRTIYDDEVARAAELAPGLYVLEAGGRSVQFDLMSVAEAADALCAKARPASDSIIQAAHSLIEDVAENLPVGVDEGPDILVVPATDVMALGASGSLH